MHTHWNGNFLLTPTVATSIAIDSVLQHLKAVNQTGISHQESASASPVLQSEVANDPLSILNRDHDCMYKIYCVMAGYLLSYSAVRKEKPLTAL